MSHSIDVSKLKNVEFLLAQLLCGLKSIAQARRVVQSRSHKALAVNGREVDHPLDLRVAGPNWTRPTAAVREKGSSKGKSSQFWCTLCMKKQRKISGRAQHRRTHNICKPYACDYVNCNEDFMTSELLEEHRSQKHSQCFFCSEAFPNSAELKLHLRKCQLLQDVMAEIDAKRRKEDEQSSRPSSVSSAYRIGEWIMSSATKSLSSARTSDCLSSPDLFLNLNF